MDSRKVEMENEESRSNKIETKNDEKTLKSSNKVNISTKNTNLLLKDKNIKISNSITSSPSKITSPTSTSNSSNTNITPINKSTSSNSNITSPTSTSTSNSKMYDMPFPSSLLSPSIIGVKRRLSNDLEFNNQRASNYNYNEMENNKPSKLKIDKSLCYLCSKKLKFFNTYECRCGNNYCNKHRFFDQHKCSYDFIKVAKQILKKDNPRVVPKKL